MSLISKFIPTYGSVAIVSFLSGAVLTLLKLSSVVTIVQSVPAETFPKVFLLSIAYLYGTDYFFSKLESARPKTFLAFSFLLPAFIILFNSWALSRSSLSLVITNYLLTLTGISLLDAGLRHFQTQGLSMLSADHERNSFLLSEEYGQLIASLLIMLSPGLPLQVLMALSLGLYLLMNLDSLQIRTNFYQQKEQKIKHSNNGAEWSLVIMLSIFVAIKLSYGILLYDAYKTLELDGKHFQVTFLVFSIFQSLASIWGLSKRKKTGSFEGWERGIWIYLIPQMLLLILCVAFSNPLLAIAAGSLRKTLNHTALNPSLLKLSHYLPAHMLLRIKRRIDTLGHLMGAGFIALVLHYKTAGMNSGLIPGLLAAMVILGFGSAYLSTWQIRSYFVNQLSGQTVAQTLGSILGLASCINGPLKKTLLQLLAKTQSQHIKLLIIGLLKNTLDDETESAIFNEYNKTTREDIKVACVESLSLSKNPKYQNHFLGELELISLEIQSKEAFRWKLYQRICKINPSESLEKLLDILGTTRAEESTRGTSNLILLLGGVAEEQKLNLKRHLEAYLHPQQARRIRVNAAISCIKTGTDKTEFKAFFEELRASKDEKDQLAWAYAQGELNWTESIEDIKALGHTLVGQEMTCQLALLKLGDTSNIRLTANLYEKLDEGKRMEFIHQLSHVKDQKARLAFYEALLTYNTGLAADLMEKLSYSKRDFDDDLSRILFSLREKGIEIGKMKITRFAHYS